jgi:hypothetical protein
VWSADRLVTELNRLGVHFVTGGELEWSAPSLPPAELLAGLASQSEARLRLALIPLFLVHPRIVPPFLMPWPALRGAVDT